MRDSRQPTTFGWYILDRMAEAGYPTQSALIRAIKRKAEEAAEQPEANGEAAPTLSRSTLSRWIYDEGRPDIDGLRGLAAALHVTEDEVAAAAGYGPMAADMAQAIAALRPAPLDDIAAELNQVLTDSRVPAEERQAVRAAVDRVLDRARIYLRRRRSA